ncbi:lipoate--protein ligase family protein [bacterium]|nr:MAG: lipoate--protein ligase family protein [bacterium]
MNRTTIPSFLKDCKEIAFSGDRWLIVVDPPLSGEENMDRDRKLLEWAYKDQWAVPVLRFFQWRPPAVSIGFMQPFEQIDINKCNRLGIDVVRRPTGGKAIYHHTEFTYSVTLPPYHPLAKMSVLETYNFISRALALGLRYIGINAKLSRGSPKVSKRNPSCFSSTSRYEIVVDGKKLVGSAQRRRFGAVLQQGSIIAGPQYLLLSELVAQDGELVSKELQEHSTYIEKVLGYIPLYEDFVEAILRGFSRAFETFA